MALPNLPVQGQDPWYTERDNFDDALRVEIEGRLSDSQLKETFQVARTVDMLTLGAAADGTTNDWTVFTQARTEAGTEGAVWFPPKNGSVQTRYRIPGSRPDMSGTHLITGPGVVLVFDEANPNVKTWNLLTPVTIESILHNRTLVHPASLSPDSIPAWAANVSEEPATFTKSHLTSWTGLSATLGGTGTVTRGAFEGTLTANEVTWPTTTAFTAQGVERSVEVGVYYEATIICGTAGRYHGLMFLTDVDGWAWFRVQVGASVAGITGSTAPGDLLASPSVGTSIALPNGGAYGVVNVSRMGYVFDTPTSVRVYLNQLFVTRLTFNQPVEDVAFAAAAGTSWSSFVIRDCVRSEDWSPPVVAPCTFSAIGDSQTYGAWASIAWPDLVPMSLSGLNGGGLATVRQNLAVSGTSTSNWASGGTYDVGLTDFTPDDYVLVMLGTNDVQGSVSSATFEANILYIANSIISDGAIPIFGLFPTWTTTSVTGGGVTTQNYAIAASLRGRLTRFCAENGYEMALVNSAFGANLAYYLDNLHPDERAAALIARAFAQAVARHRLRVAGIS